MDEDLKYYNGVYSESTEYRKHPSKSRYYYIWQDILILTNISEDIIEIGCGSGQLGKLLIDNGRNYRSGFDYSEEAIKIAKKLNIKNESLFFVQDLYDISHIDAETVICTEVLEHLEYDLHVFKILNSGTRFIFSVPDFWYKSHKRVFKTIEEIEERYACLEIKWYKKHKTKGGNNIFVVDSVVK